MTYRPYKRIFHVDPSQVTDLLSHQRSGVIIREAHSGEENEWVAIGPFNERGLIDKIVRLFDQQAA